MVGMKVNRKPLWVRHVDEANGITVYAEAEPTTLNLFPMNAEADLIALGSEYIENMRARIPIKEASAYDIGDLLYEAEPTYKDMTDVGNATYRIIALLPTLNVTEMRCVRLSGSK